MTQVNREHLAGLQYAAVVAEENWPTAALTEILNDLIAHASAAPEQEPALYLRYVEGEGTDWTQVKELADKWVSAGYAVQSLYTHAADGEVERLRAALDTQKQVADEAWEEVDKARNNCKMIIQKMDANRFRAETAEQQMAEARALLRETTETLYCESSDGADVVKRVNAFLSDTAQSAEVKL